MKAIFFCLVLILASCVASQSDNSAATTTAITTTTITSTATTTATTTAITTTATTIQPDNKLATNEVVDSTKSVSNDSSNLQMCSILLPFSYFLWKMVY
ncbi:unnamed protein product [Brachionus calyciflorus]|uniref:Uncharacterized protein n=1 Tax=Brachionus calyciflorus TaxID=104777 RepID=A0A813M0T0_9BILA|nr:unnamed protein product [Brachionus calyciflorus]